MKKFALLLATLVPLTAPAQFALKEGDRVVFYGDSITDQRLYSLFTETFVRTRFPKMNVSFVHSGWGGDLVSGGGGGPIDVRLDRDVFPYKPTVVTIMLGMNDASYRAFDAEIFNRYATGYRHIVDRLRRESPSTRLTLIQPSPFDDVTRAPNFPGGYNAVLLQYSDFVRDLATRNRASVADLNKPVVAMLERANATDPAGAQRLIPDRVHPGEAGHLAMAQALLKSWNAPSVVSAVEIDGDRVVRTENAKVTRLTRSANGALAWTQLDEALPFPLNLADPLVKLSVASSDFVSALDQQPLIVKGLTGRYNLAIDGKTLTTVTAEELAAGVNLAILETPMRAQAARVHTLARNRAEAHNLRWRALQASGGLGTETEATKEREATMKSFDRYDQALHRAAQKTAQPKPHQFTLTPAN